MAVMFEGERCFEGTRTFFTQGIDKAVMNVFKLFAKLGSQLVESTSSGAQVPENYEDDWDKGAGPEVNGWATLTETKSLEAFVYCHEDTWETDGICQVEFIVEKIPFEGPYKVTHYRIDKDHSNAYTERVRQGRPDFPAGGQFRAIKDKAELEFAEPVRVVVPLDGKVKLLFWLPVKSVSLLVIEKAEKGESL